MGKSENTQDVIIMDVNNFNKLTIDNLLDLKIGGKRIKLNESKDSFLDWKDNNTLDISNERKDVILTCIDKLFNILKSYEDLEKNLDSLNKIKKQLSDNNIFNIKIEDDEIEKIKELNSKRGKLNYVISEIADLNQTEIVWTLLAITMLEKKN